MSTNPLRLNCRLRLYGETLSADTVMITTTVMRYTETPMCLPEINSCHVNDTWYLVGYSQSKEMEMGRPHWQKIRQEMDYSCYNLETYGWE